MLSAQNFAQHSQNYAQHYFVSSNVVHATKFALLRNCIAVKLYYGFINQSHQPDCSIGVTDYSIR